jgi:hypothetical protein
MRAINFKEIPEAHVPSGEQDTFELFAADFLEAIGYEILERPSRGADLGKDLLILERRKGVGGETVVRWLVSCKHKAHSGRSVSLDDEQNVVERVEGKDCRGFLAFYSTLPSSSLAARLNELKSRFETQVFDSALIEKHLLAENGIPVATRYFPESIRRWKSQHPRPATIFSEPEKLECEVCGTDLLGPSPSGIFVLWENAESDLEQGDELVDAHWCCKGRCDRVLEQRMRSKHGSNVVDGWEDIPDLCVPLIFLRRLMAFLNGFQNGDRWSPEAFQKLKKMLIAVYQHVARDASPEEQERIKRLLEMPSYLGGLGTE